MKYLVILLSISFIFVIYYSATKETSHPLDTSEINKAYAAAADSINNAKARVSNIISESFKSGNKKICILVKDTIYTKTEVDKMIIAAKSANFLAEKCIVELWTNEKAQSLYDKYIDNDIPDSKYIFVAEHLLATHYGFIPETVYNELMDSHYRDLGGKKLKIK
jgi:hypothetical protein